jgi:type IV pilus assembly protein PilB
VFSTLHTNDAPSALTRLIDMGIKPFLVASSIQAIMAQRLVRTLCRECKIPDENPDKQMMKTVGMTPEMLVGKTIYKANGCPHCNNTGYRGRQGIFELLQMNTEIRELAFNRAGLTDLRRAAKATGMSSLLQDGQKKILRGMTTIEELSRLAQADVEME